MSCTCSQCFADLLSFYCRNTFYFSFTWKWSWATFMKPNKNVSAVAECHYIDKTSLQVQKRAWLFVSLWQTFQNQTYQCMLWCCVWQVLMFVAHRLILCSSHRHGWSLMLKFSPNCVVFHSSSISKSRHSQFQYLHFFC